MQYNNEIANIVHLICSVILYILKKENSFPQLLFYCNVPEFLFVPCTILLVDIKHHIVKKNEVKCFMKSQTQKVCPEK